MSWVPIAAIPIDTANPEVQVPIEIEGGRFKARVAVRLRDETLGEFVESAQITLARYPYEQVFYVLGTREGAVPAAIPASVLRTATSHSTFTSNKQSPTEAMPVRWRNGRYHWQRQFNGWVVDAMYGEQGTEPELPARGVDGRQYKTIKTVLANDRIKIQRQTRYRRRNADGTLGSYTPWTDIDFLSHDFTRADLRTTLGLD